VLTTKKQARRTIMSDAIQQAIEALRMTKYCIPAYGFHAEKVTIDEAIAGLQALQHSGEPVAWMSPNKQSLEFSRPDTVYGSHTIPLYTTPQPVVPEGYVLVPKTALDGALYLAGLAVAHTDFGSQHRADFKVCCDALLSAGKVGE
jgi:hypothetical protein